MIERFLVVHGSGLVLYDYSFDSYATAKIDACLNEWLVKTMIEKMPFKQDEFLFANVLDNQNNLIFLVIYQKAYSTQVPYVEDLLKVCRMRFIETYPNQLREIAGSQWVAEFNFGGEFKRLLNGFADRQREKDSRSKRPEHQHKGSKKKKKNRSKPNKNLAADDDEDDEDEEDEEAQELGEQAPGVAEEKQESTEDGVEALCARAEQEQGGSQQTATDVESIQPGAQPVDASAPIDTPVTAAKGPALKKKAKKAKKAAAAVPKKTTKTGRTWDEPYLQSPPTRGGKKGPAGTSGSGAASSSSEPVVRISKDQFKLDSWNESDDKDEDEAAVNVDTLVALSEEKKAQATKRGFFSRYLGTLTGRTLEAADLAPVMEDFVHHLESKNVAVDVARELCKSVAESLEGRNLPSFTRVESTVREALDQSLLRILTPKRQIDILRDAKEKQGSGRPYVIVFCGVNGVGKSTSLAKIACWLKANDLRVLIVACDTFRSAAIEQLEIHANRLEIPLYQQGYGKSPAMIAESAIRKHRTTTDVVLVDTAGRMQDNEPLMKCLCTLIQVNDPDLVLFVGEALVGNDGVDQLTKFNDALRRLSRLSSATERSIDGIVLTKFDTIDDKVGAALSMVFIVGAPIVFLGTGQHYPDLKQMIPGAIVRSLLR